MMADWPAESRAWADVHTDALASGLTPADYSAGHPWYYLLGGEPLTPAQIEANARQSARDHIETSDVTTCGVRRAISKAKDQDKQERILRRIIADNTADAVTGAPIHLKQQDWLAGWKDGTQPECNGPFNNVIDAVHLTHNHLSYYFRNIATATLLLAEIGATADMFGRAALTTAAVNAQTVAKRAAAPLQGDATPCNVGLFDDTARNQLELF